MKKKKRQHLGVDLNAIIAYMHEVGNKSSQNLKPSHAFDR